MARLGEELVDAAEIAAADEEGDRAWTLSRLRGYAAEEMCVILGPYRWEQSFGRRAGCHTGIQCDLSGAVGVETGCWSAH
jgi:hypothetical protein